MVSLPSRSKVTANGSSSKDALAAQEELRNLEDALGAVALAMDDDIEGAECELAKADSVYHKLAIGLVAFLRATLGFERDIMADAQAKLGAADSAAQDCQGVAEKSKAGPRPGRLYPPGTEYILSQAEAQIMGSVVGVLRESLTEALKGFYKIRKAVGTLKKIGEMEEALMGDRPGSKSAAKPRSATLKSVTNEGGTRYTTPAAIAAEDDDSDDEDLFVDAADGPIYEEAEDEDPFGISTATSEIDPALFDNTTDQYIHSGYRMLHGILLLVLGIIPPTFHKILSIVGFHGDRDRGLRLLWEAANMHLGGTDASPGVKSNRKGSELNSAIASIALLLYYNGLVSNLDILEKGAHPKQRCKALLAHMYAKYPHSSLWLLNQAQMHGANRELHQAVKILSESGPPANLRQIEALRNFECGLDVTFMHDYPRSAELFIKCLELNSWSPAMYYYIAGCAHVELYRKAKYSTTDPNPKEAEKQAAQALVYLGKVLESAGKKKLMAKLLPFDAFTTRKMHKWQKRAEKWGIPLIDAIGVSPIEEIIFFWRGHQRMDESMLRQSLENLWWSDGGERDVWTQTRPAMRSDPNASREVFDEFAVLAFLRATIYRQLKDIAAARTLLLEEIIEGHDKEKFKGDLKDDYTAPIARYEMAVCAWYESGESDEMRRVVDEATRDAKLRECSKWLHEIASWDSYTLDSRIGIKVSTGLQTLKKMGYP